MAVYSAGINHGRNTVSDYWEKRASQCWQASQACALLVLKPSDPALELEFLERIAALGYENIPQAIEDLRHDLRIDPEGFPLNDDGDRIEGAERRYIPVGVRK